jgi:hypothetical protein
MFQPVKGHYQGVSHRQMFEVYTYAYSLAKSMTTVFPWLYKLTSMPCGFVCVQISRAPNLLHMYALASYVSWFRNYFQSSSLNNTIRDVDFCRQMHNIAGCHDTDRENFCFICLPCIKFVTTLAFQWVWTTWITPAFFFIKTCVCINFKYLKLSQCTFLCLNVWTPS